MASLRENIAGRPSTVAKPSAPPVEAPDAFIAVFRKASPHFVRGLFPVEAGFAEKLVGIAYQLFFRRLRPHVATGNGQVLTPDHFRREAGSGMAFANECMTRQTFGAQQFGAQIAVADIIRLAVAADFRGVAKKYPNVVQHGGFFDERTVQLHLRMCPGYAQGFAGYAPAVCLQYPVCLRIGRVIFPDQVQWFHRQFVFFLQKYK
jgi:hypothetical protein